MEESIRDALLEAGEHLAEAIRSGLSAQGLPGELSVIVEDGRVVVTSRSAALRTIELGSAGVPPRALMEELGRSAATHVVRGIANTLKGFLK